MKLIVITIMLLTNISLFGQVRNFNDIPKDILGQLDKMGVDNLPLLNSYESAYFNVIFKDSLNGFDFTNKKIGFIKAPPPLGVVSDYAGLKARLQPCKNRVGKEK